MDIEFEANSTDMGEAMLKDEAVQAMTAQLAGTGEKNPESSLSIDLMSLQAKIIDLPLPENLASILVLEHLHQFTVTTLSIGILNRNSEIGIIGEFGEIEHLHGLGSKISIWDDSSVARSIRFGDFQTEPIERTFSRLNNNPEAIEICSPIPFQGANIGVLRIIAEEPLHESLLKQALKELATVIALYIHIHNLNTHIADLDFQYAKDPKPQLKPRQIEILKLMQEGNTTTQISTLLGFSSSTIHQEIILIYRLLGVHKKSEALTRAIELEMLD